MAYIALPTRDSSFLLLANAAPRLPRSAGVSASASCSGDASVRAMRVHASRLCGAHLGSHFHPRGRRVFAAVEGSVTVEEPAVSTPSAESEEETVAAEAVASPAGEGREPSNAPAKTLQRSSTVRRQVAGAKRDFMVTAEQLVVGAVFPGQVRTVQSYGAFVDIGAFTDGLVHISQLSSGFVKEVSDVVTVGQEVSVTVLELNEKSGRIALSMRDKESEAEQEALRSGSESGASSGVQGDGSGNPLNRGKIAGRGGGTARSSSRSNDDKKATTLKKGQELKGTVKNIIRNGAFVAFADEGEEGFLRGSEITEGGENVAVDSLLTIGQEVTVRVLKIERGKAALTMKPQVDMTSINDSLNTNVGAGGASNPFATFFRSANLVPSSAPAAQQKSAAPALEAGTPTASVDAPVETSTLPVEEPSAVLETPAVGEVSKIKDPTSPVVAELPAASVDAQVESGELSVDKESPAPAVEEPSAVLETPAMQVVSEAEDTPSPAVAELPAVDETSSPVAAQSEEAPAVAEEGTEDSSKAEEPRSLSLGEIAEEIGGVVAEVEKVTETAAGIVRAAS